MDLILSIFERLQIDQSIYYQFVITVVLFVILKNLFFNKLQFVIETREDKTTKLEDLASDMFAESEKLSAELRVEMDKAYAEAQTIMTKAKEEVSERESKKFKEEEKIINASADEKRAKFTAEILEQEKEVLSNTNALADSLVERLIQ